MTYNPYTLVKNQPNIHGPRNKKFDDYIYVSRKLINLAVCINNFRRYNKLSQQQMAELCTAYGRPTNVKFHFTEISKYENYQTVPTEKKFQVLLKAMHVTEEDILRRI